MNIKTQIVVAVIVILAFFYLGAMVRKNKIEIKYALPWGFMGCVILILDFFPGIIEEMAKISGVGVPINFIFFLGFCFLLALTFTLSVLVSELSQKTKTLTQKIGILEEKLESKEKTEKHD